MLRKKFERLPTYVTPKHYEVSFTEIDLEHHRFKGQLTVKLLVNEATKVIKINSGQVIVSDVVFEKGKQLVKANQLLLQFGQEMVTISFESPLEVGEGQLKLNFNGNLNKRMKGFYLCKQADGSYGASTHFEPTGARMAFPCWDEPSLKATFDISLRVPEKKTALSNMTVKNVNFDRGFKTYHFNTTPLMSTYLVAFVVGDYDFVEDKIHDKNILLRVYTPVGKEKQGRFALKVAKECLNLYNEYFGIAYPLKKCDLIAISDFPIGAMENWGLVTFREARLLCDPKNTSSATKQRIALVIGHELAHMWFGNLVTMEWWTDLWLKEGFAEFIMYMSVGQLYPDMQTWSTFVADILGPALELDALDSSHPIEVEVGHPCEVDEIFDRITYYKGASIIRMLHSFIGAENFKTGLQHYLRQYQYGNATTMNLWESFETVSDQNVGKVMSTWTKQKGFPVIEVVQRRLPAEKRIVLDITQKKFSMAGELTAEDSKAIWSVPITVCTRSEPTEKMVCLLDGRSSQVTIENVDADDWVKVNANSVGYYHVLYESSHLSELLPAVESKALSSLDRWNLQNDLFALVQAGRTSTVDVLKLMRSFVNEDDYTVWAAVDNALERLDILLSNTDDQELLHAFGREIYQNIYANVGWNASPNEPHTRTLLRSLVIRRLGAFGDENVTNVALKHFDAHVKGSSVLAADLRSAVYRTVIHSKRKHIFDALMKLYREADLHEEKNRIFAAMGYVDDQTQIERVLQFAMSNEVRRQDTHFVLGSLASSMKGRNAAWHHFKASRDEYRRRYDGSVGFGDIVKSVTQNFASDSKATEIEQFFDIPPPIPGTERSLKQALETIRIQAKWLNRDLESIRKYLS